MRKLVSGAVLAVVMLAATAIGASLTGGTTAEAVIDEQVGAACNGKDPLSPPGISGRSRADNFAQPVISTGAVVISFVPPPFNVTIGDSPAAKYPAGTQIVVAGVDQDLTGLLDHPSSDHCKALNP